MKAINEVGFKAVCKYIFYETALIIFRFMFISPLRVCYLKLLGAKIGKNAIIHSISFFNCYRKGFQGLKMGENCFIGNQCLFDLADEIEFGNNVTLAERVTIITHLNVGYSNHALQKFFPASAKKVVIKNDVFIGTNSTILSGVMIESRSFVGAMSLVADNVESNCFVAGIPAKFIRAIG